VTIAQRQYGGRAVAERKAERRLRFLVAATRVFAERGYANCSLADVCAAAALSKRQFYEEFSTREDLLVAAYDRVQDEAATAVTKALTTLEESADIRTAIAVLLGAYLESMNSDPYRANLAYIQVVGVSDRMEQHRRTRRRSWARLLELSLAPMAGPAARIRGTGELGASVLMGAVNGLAHEWLMTDPRPPVEELVDLLVPVALSLIVAD
jgi:AcrR family transcriptional regulator